jgi:hypothetical protein
MATHTPDIEDRLRDLEKKYEVLTLTIRPPRVPSWIANLLSGITLASIIGFAFWLGSINSKINEHGDKIDKLNEVVLQSRESLTSRVSAVEAKLDSIDKKLDEINGKLK